MDQFGVIVVGAGPRARTRDPRGSGAAAGSRIQSVGRMRLQHGGSSRARTCGISARCRLRTTGLLVCVGVAADVHEQGGVVDGAAFAIVEADSIGDAQGDDALAEDVLHRLPEAEVDAQRQRRDELGEPHVQTISVGQAAILRPRPAHP